MALSGADRYSFLVPLRLYNTLAKKEEDFVSLTEGEVRMYTCGPTVYGRPHVGNYSSFLMADLLRRWLLTSGYRVTYVKNITDVGHLLHDRDQGDDKVEKEAKKEQVHPLEIAKRYTQQYLDDERALAILDADFRPRATETIPEMIAIVEELLKKGHAYETSDGIYFSVESFPAYGRLSGNTLENLNAGARVDVREEKKHPADFALWKKTVGENSHHVLRWEYPSGKIAQTSGDDAHAGFPGWHIECSAMSRKFLGDTFDIHTGGEDNIFPHHECEIAQSESAFGKPFVRMWLHKRRIDLGSEKMSKSLGNVLTLPDIVAKGYSPLDLRYYLLSVHYRTQLKFTWKGMDDARKARRKIVEWMEEVKTEERVGSSGMQKIDAVSFMSRFVDAMNADLNTPAALAAVFDAVNAFYANRPIDAVCRSQLIDFIEKVRFTFGCFEDEQKSVPPAVQELVDARAAARARKDFSASDRLRDEIAAAGYEVRDMAEGQSVRPL